MEVTATNTVLLVLAMPTILCILGGLFFVGIDAVGAVYSRVTNKN